MTSKPTTSELLTVLAARELAGCRVVFAGHGLPTLAVALAKETVAPHVEMVYESGVVGAHPRRLPLSISDSTLADGAECILGMPQLFGYMIQGGRIQVGFLGAAQIDRYGNLNSTLIAAKPDAPAHRLPGSGGAIEVMGHAREVFVVMRRHTPQTLVAALDYVTSPTPKGSGGVTRVITELGVLGRGEDDEELVLTRTNTGVDAKTVVAATGWPLRTDEHLSTNALPTTDEISILRRLDPDRLYLR